MTRLTLILCVIFVATVLAGIDYAGERPVWQLIGNNWQSLGALGQAGARARAWCGPYSADSCNKEVWNLPFRHKASVAQWIKWSLENDGYYWLIRKPGNYVTDGISLFIMSNYDVAVTFSGFENLSYCGPGNAIDPTIEVKYAFTDDYIAPPAPDDPKWKTPEELNNLTFYIEDSEQLHNVGWRKYIWAWINVSRCNTACNYKDPNDATITLTLQRIKPWIDPVTGLFDNTKVNDYNWRRNFFTSF